ncbi:glycerophosphodiester phosphodiesterase family protein [Maribacter sp. Asnod1-A12]|uniref:glycerophosphodiester phosphodiesterase family protein n=1 Tax=Maribacter sp. Asnod1-A12 TaxID=3160576 RepID=UPI00386B3379
MRLVVTVFIVIVLSSCGSSKKNLYVNQNVVIAHRGAWKANNLPENSVAALKHAIKINCKGSEFDIRMTSNDSLIVTHDAEFAGLDIEESTYEKLSQFPLKNGEVLPTLRTYLLAGLKNNKSTLLVCEIKPSKDQNRSIIIAEKVFSLVKELEAEDKVVYISFSYAILKRLEELDATVKTQYLDGSKSPEKLRKDGIDGVDYYYTKFKNNADWIESAKKNNITLNAWTVNEANDIDWLLDQDFDYITTNEPELVFERIKTKQKQ